MNNPPPSLQELGPDDAEMFDPIVARSLSKDPDDRYPSAGDLGRAAKAASVGSINTVPERSLATGVAATGIPAGEDATAGEGFHERQKTRVLADGKAKGATGTTKVRKRNPNPGRNRVLIALAALATIAVVAGVAILVVAGLGKNSNTSVRLVQTPAGPATVTETNTTSAVGQPTPSSPPVSIAPASYVPYSPSDPHYAYSATLPFGNGWGAPIESNPTNGDLLRTTVRGPENSILVIDRTPSDVPQLGGGYDSSRTVSQPAFGSATEYIFSSSKSLAECTGASCVDYLIDDGQGGGWGVLGGGPSLPVASEVASQVTQTVGP